MKLCDYVVPQTLETFSYEVSCLQLGFLIVLWISVSISLYKPFYKAI
jgi:hypothetical protein